jgi:hypothetical protein
MKQIQAMILTSLVTFISWGAGATQGGEMLTVACYGEQDSIYWQFFTGDIGVTMSYTINGVEGSYMLVPGVGLGQKASYVTIDQQPGHIKAVAQMVGGDPDTVKFLGSSEIELVLNADGKYILKSAKVYKDGVKVNTDSLINVECYAQ